MRDVSPPPVYLPVHKCKPCETSFVHDKAGRVACPKCGQPPLSQGAPVAANVTR